jgi:hypothetical protein
MGLVGVGRWPGSRNNGVGISMVGSRAAVVYIARGQEEVQVRRDGLGGYLRWARKRENERKMEKESRKREEVGESLGVSVLQQIPPNGASH